MSKPVSYKIRLLYFLAFVLVFLIGFPVLIFYSAGYTLDETFGLSFRGGIYVFSPETGTSVFVGNELKGQTSFFQREVLVKNLKPDNYLVLVANEDFWPWAKQVTVERGEVEPLFPLLVPKTIKMTEVKVTDPAYKKTVALFKSATSTLFSTISPSLSATVASSTIDRRQTAIRYEDQAIFASWLDDQEGAPKYFCQHGSCVKPILVFQSFVPIRSFDFYPSRDDAIILALDTGIYAVELDSRPYQNFYPLYSGQEPDFRISNNQVYIKDNDYLAVLNLEQ